MLNSKVKEFLYICLITLLALTSISNLASGQNFYNEYKSWLIKKESNRSTSIDSAINLDINFLRQTLERFEKVHGHSIFSRDTIFIIELYKEKGDSIVVWNKNESCQYTYLSNKYVSKIKGPVIEVNAYQTVKKLPRRLKKWMINTDTIKFSKYAMHIKSLKCTMVVYVRAVKLNGHWNFIRAVSDYIDL